MVDEIIEGTYKPFSMFLKNKLPVWVTDRELFYVKVIVFLL